MRRGRCPQESQLSPGAVPPAARPPRRQKAIGALAASILTIVYHMLRGGELHNGKTVLMIISAKQGGWMTAKRPVP